MKKLSEIFTAIFVLLIVIPAIIVFASKDKSFSDNENRALQTRPAISGEDILDGDFQEALTKYISDQYPLRDKFTALGSTVKKLVGYKDIGGVYLADDGCYFEKKTNHDISLDKYIENLGLINDFAVEHEGIPVTALLVPEASTIYPEKLPEHALTYDAKGMFGTACEYLPECSVPNLYGALCEARGDYIFYKTDHHWTTKGAYTAYSLLMGRSGAFDGRLELVSDSFLGTTYSKTLDPDAGFDSVYIAPVSDKLSVIADGRESAVYDMSKVDVKDKYLVFFGGNFGQVNITGGGDGSRVLLVIKDSYANCLVPMLTCDYGTVIMLDLRYFNGSVKDIMANSGVTEVLFVGEMSNIAADDNLYKLEF